MNGCETQLDSNPTCPSGVLFALPGDVPSAPTTVVGVGEQTFHVRVSEVDFGAVPRNLSVRFTLTSPPGVDYRLEGGCEGCGVMIVGATTFSLSWNEIFLAPPSDREVLVNVVYDSGGACGEWSLQMEGGVPSPLTCPPL
jgi:hypothetical protein